jgi:hypothetical protein
MGGARKLVTVVQSGLADEMRDIRNGCGLSLEIVCDKLNWQQSKLSRMENGQQCISDIDLGALLAIYDVYGDERRRLQHMAERQDDPGHWERMSPDDQKPRTLVRLEAKVKTIVNAEPLLVPGLVQTADYARVVLTSGHVRPENIEPRVEARLARQSHLTKDNPPKVDLILDEHVLRRVVGSHKIMARQLRALLEFAELPNLRLWIIPLDRGGSIGFDYSFYLMNFRHGRPVVFLENTGSGLFIEDREEIDYYQRHAGKLGTTALNPDDSARFVATLAKEHERE